MEELITLFQLWGVWLLMILATVVFAAWVYAIVHLFSEGEFFLFFVVLAFPPAVLVLVLNCVWVEMKYRKYEKAKIETKVNYND